MEKTRIRLQCVSGVIIFLLLSVSVPIASWAANGDLKWTFQTYHPVDSSPAVGDDGTIYVGSQGFCYAINPDGTMKWAFSTHGGAGVSSPAIGPDGTLYVGSWVRIPGSGTSKNSMPH